MKSILGLVALASLVATPLFAEGSNQAVSIKDLQLKCAELAGNPQIQPFKASVTCSMTTFRWEPTASGTVTLKSQKIVGGSVLMKSFFVPQLNRTYDGAESVQACGTFQKVSDTVNSVDIELGCQELAEITDLSAFCEPHVVQRVSEDPAIVTSAATGEQFTLCPRSTATAAN